MKESKLLIFPDYPRILRQLKRPAIRREVIVPKEGKIIDFTEYKKRKEGRK